MPAEYIVEERAKLWANRQHTIPAVPGGTTKECATLNEVTTCPLEADAGECKVLLMEATFIHFTSTEEEIPNGPVDEPAAPLTDKKQDEAVEPTDERPDEAAEEMPTVPPTEEADDPDDEGDKPDDNPEEGPPAHLRGWIPMMTLLPTKWGAPRKTVRVMTIW